MRTTALLAIVVLLAAGAAQATTVPDLTASFINVSYSSGTRDFTADGFLAAFDLNGVPPPDYSASGSFSIQMHLKADYTLDYGTLTAVGTIPALTLSGTLLSGNITEFTYTASPGFNVFHLGVSGLGGGLAPYFQPTAEVVLSSFCSSTGVFTPAQDYAGNLYGGTADVHAGAVPEPLTVAGLLLGLSGLGGYLRKRLA